MESTAPDRTFRLVLYDALASEAMSTLTAGVFLTGFLVELGASNLAIGVLAAVPFVVQFLQLPAVVLVERLRAGVLSLPGPPASAGLFCSPPRPRRSWAPTPVSLRWSCAWRVTSQWPPSPVVPGIPGCAISCQRVHMVASLAAAPRQRPHSPPRSRCSAGPDRPLEARDAGASRVRLCWPVHRKCRHRLFWRLAAVDHARPADVTGRPAHAHC